MAGGSAGFGSAIALRAKEAMQRAKVADALGLGSPLPSGQGASTQSGTSPFVSSAQPVATPPAAANPDLDKRMYGMVESFLAGLNADIQTETFGEKPRGVPPTTILPDEGRSGTGV